MSLSALKDNFNLTTAYALLATAALVYAGWYIYQNNPTELQHKLDAANAECLSAKDEAEKAIAEAEIAKNEAGIAIKEKKELEEIIVELRKIIEVHDGYPQRIRELENEKKTLESYLYKCQAELDIALKKLEEYKTKMPPDPFNPDKQDIKILQDENIQLKRDLEVATKEAKKSSELTAAIENLNKTVENLNNEIRNKNDEISRLTKELSNPDRQLSDALNNIPGFQNLPVKDQNEYRQDLLKLKSKIQKYIDKKGF